LHLAARIGLYAVQGVSSLIGGFLFLFIVLALAPGSGISFYSSSELVIAVVVYLIALVATGATFVVLHGSWITVLAPGAVGFLLSLAILFLFSLVAGCPAC